MDEAQPATGSEAAPAAAPGASRRGQKSQTGQTSQTGQKSQPGQTGQTRQTSRSGRTGRLVRRYGPWLVAAAILGWIFDRVPIGGAIEALQSASLAPFLAATAAAVLYWFLVESRTYAFLFSRFNAPLSWAEARSLRGLTYLLTPINWNLGTAAIVLHLRRTKGLGALEVTSSLMLYAAADSIVIPGLLLIGSLAMPTGTFLGDARVFAALFILGQVFLLVAVMSDAPRWGWLERVRGVRLFQAYRKARIADLAVLLTARAVYMAGFVLLFWWGTRTFGIDAPFAFVTASMPLVLLSAALPITPGGLGTQQAAMLFLYGPYGEEGAILGFALAYPVAVILLRMGIGLRYLPDLRAFRAAEELALREEAGA